MKTNIRFPNRIVQVSPAGNPGRAGYRHDGLINIFGEEARVAFSYRGEAEVAFLGEEVRAGELCRKYRIDGPGLENRGGTIWVNKRGGHFQALEIALPDSPSWQRFKFKL